MKQPDSKNWFRSGWLSTALLLGSMALIVAILQWARQVLIPVALAVLLTFILAPIVTAMRRGGLGRASAVLITVVLTLTVIAAAGTMIFGELKSLADDLPGYRQNIRQKITDVRLLSQSATLKKVQETVNDAVAEFQKEDAGATNKAAVPVVVTGSKNPERSLMSILSPLMEPLGSTGLVVVLVIFMLLRREDLRDRLLRLAGYGRLTATTKAIDEAGHSVSRYLFRQCLVNLGFGLAVGFGLFFIGLHYAILWGFLAGVARFIPYFGPCLGALSPTLVSLAVFNGWKGPLLVIGLFAVLELVTNAAVEPFVYGKGTGVSEVSLLVMMAFWTWLWGPIGLVLATPLTVCLMVISKSIPDLEFISVLLSNKPALEPHYAFYQRLVARDPDESRQIVHAFLKDRSLIELFEELLIPALLACRQDFERGKLMDEDHAFIVQMIGEILQETPGSGPAPAGTMEQNPVPTGAPRNPGPLLIFGSPAVDEMDELALRMFGHILPAQEAHLRVLSSELFSAETMAEVEKVRPALLCVCMLPGDKIFTVRQFCKRLRSRFPDMPVVIGHWGGPKYEKIEEQLAGLVEAVGWTLAESRNQVVQFGQASRTIRSIQSERLRIEVELPAAFDPLASPKTS